MNKTQQVLVFFFCLLVLSVLVYGFIATNIVTRLSQLPPQSLTAALPQGFPEPNATTTGITNLSDNRTDYPDSNIPKYEKYEVTFNLKADTYSNPYDPAVIDVQGHFIDPLNGQEKIVYGFWYQEYTRTKDAQNKEVLTLSGTPIWKVRFTPTQTGTYQYYITAADASGIGRYPAAGTLTFDAVDSSNAGFLRISQANSEFFAFDNGDPFFGIGMNVGWWSPYTKKSYFYDEFFGTMKQNKANFARVWMVNANGGQYGTDWVVTIQQDKTKLGGNYDLADAWRMDQILRAAKDNGVYIQLNLEDVNTFAYNWEDNIYNIVNGGPCSTEFDFLTDTTARYYNKRIWRYIISRYGYSINLVSWELWNEINELMWSDSTFNWEEVETWYTDMIAYVKSIDSYDHLVTTSSGSALTYDFEGFDYTQMHAYYVKNFASYYWGSPDMSRLISVYTNSMRKYIPNKPKIFGEFGALGTNFEEDQDAFYSAVNFDAYGNPSPKLTGTFDTEGIHLHNALWTGIMEGLAATPLAWGWPQHLLYPDLWKHYAPIANYLEGTNFSDTSFVSVNSRDQNLIKTNPGFEDDFMGWSKNPPSTTKFSIDNIEYHNGAKSLKWENNVSEFIELGYGALTLMPGQDYIMSGWLKTENVVAPYGGIKLSVAFNDGSVAPGDMLIVRNTQYYKGTSDEWIPINIFFTSPSYVDGGYNYTSQFSINFEAAVGVAWVDDIKITPVGIYAAPSSDNSNLRIIARKNNTSALVWIQNIDHTFYNIGKLGNTVNSESGTITIPNMTPGTYSVEWWKLWNTNGTPLADPIITTTSTTTDSNNNLNIYVDQLYDDTAVKINRTGDIPLPPADICPNITGTQETIPTGYELVGGQCVVIPPPADTTPPSTPTLSVSSKTDTIINLAWTLSADLVGVAGYNVYKNNDFKVATTTLGYSDTGLTASTLYTYAVSAFDAAGNWSATSTLSVTTNAVTPPPATPDTQAPSIPANLTFSSVTTTGMTISWSPSSDNTAVTGYRIYRDNRLLGSTAITSYSDVGLSPSTEYSYIISAYDAVNNTSDVSPSFKQTTSAQQQTTTTTPPPSGGGGGGGGGGPTSLPPASSPTTSTSLATTTQTTSTTTSTTALAPTVQSQISSTPLFTTTLKYGMTSNEVKKLQELLSKDKEIYPEQMVTGYYGTLTQLAVQRFQKKHRPIPSSKDSEYGIVGAKTRQKLQEVFGGQTTLVTSVGSVGQATTTTAVKLTPERIAEIRALILQLQNQIKELLRQLILLRMPARTI